MGHGRSIPGAPPGFAGIGIPAVGDVFVGASGGQLALRHSTGPATGFPVLSASPNGTTDGLGTQAMADANQTPAAAVLANHWLVTTGAITADRTLTLPAPASDAQSYSRTIVNSCTGTGFAVLVSIGSGTTIRIRNGATRRILVTTAGVQSSAGVNIATDYVTDTNITTGDLVASTDGMRFSRFATAAGVSALLGSFTAANVRSCLGADATGTGPIVSADSPQFTTTLTIAKNSVGTTVGAAGSTLSNTTLATNVLQQYSGCHVLSTQQWTGATSQQVDATTQLTCSTANTFLAFQFRSNLGAWSTAGSISNAGAMSVGSLTSGAAITCTSGNFISTAGTFVANTSNGVGFQFSGVTNIVFRLRSPAARLSSSGAGVVVLATLAITTGTARRLRGSILGVKSDGTVVYSYSYVASAISPAGTATVNATVTADAGSSTTTTAPTIAASSGNLVVSSGDTAATAIRWTVTYTEDTELIAA